MVILDKRCYSCSVTPFVDQETYLYMSVLPFMHACIHKHIYTHTHIYPYLHVLSASGHQFAAGMATSKQSTHLPLKPSGLLNSLLKQLYGFTLSLFQLAELCEREYLKFLVCNCFSSLTSKGSLWTRPMGLEHQDLLLPGASSVENLDLKDLGHKIEMFVLESM